MKDFLKEVEELRRAVAELHRWQTEALAVLARWNAVSKFVRADVTTLGHDIPTVVLERVKERDELQEENAFLHELLNAEAWVRINAMKPEELEAELLAAGYTKERLDAGLAKLRKSLAEASNQSPCLPSPATSPANLPTSATSQP